MLRHPPKRLGSRPAGPRRRTKTALRLFAALALASTIAVGSGATASEALEAPPSTDVYTIGVEDVLRVFVWQDTNLNSLVAVRPDGRITVPLVGDLVAVGKTTDVLAAEIAEALRKYMRDPVVTVVVDQINHMKVYVLGEVGSQGELVLRAPTRFLQAIAMAGGFTEFADRSKVLLIRSERDAEERIEIDYRKIVNGERPQDNIWLRPGDTLVVRN